ncbi:MAG: GNAT family N-acetyltransferase [Deltaproteobacteria bacterium]|nr:GNAT family N-acetyltransferase [Deltaproteobacteria bacterium]
MKIVNISPENESLYYCCLEDWSEEMKEAGDHKQRWYKCMKNKGVRVKFAVDENDVIGGMIQYLPIEYSMCEGKDLYLILCIWVHGYKEGRGNFRKKGMGKALLKAAEEDCKEIGTNGLVAWGLGIPVWMKASWYKRQGYKVIDRKGIMRLVWKPFNETAVKPSFIKTKKKPGKGEEKVNISMFRNGWCPAMNITHERTLRAIKEFEDKIELKEYDTLDREVIDEWGISDGIYIDGKAISTGPPLSYEKIRKKIKKRVAAKKM